MAIVLLTHTVRFGHADIVKKHLIELMYPFQVDDGFNRHAWGMHVDQQKRDALLNLALVGRAYECKHHIGELRVTRPNLAAVDDIVITVTHGGCTERCQVRARTWHRSVHPP